MKDGYYLSTFLVDGKLPCALDIKLRHDQTVALWYKKSDTIELVRYWELERFSGWKQHTFTFFSTEQLYSTIEFLLKTVGLKMEDIVEILGTPSIDTANDYIDENVYNGIGYHNICHLFSAFLCEENKENEDILMFALDSGPDSVGQYGAYYKLYYSGAYWHDNSLEIFPVQSPGKLWSSSKKRFCMREGTLMALASACKAEVNVDYNKEVELIDEAALENALEYLDGLAKHIEKYGFSVDERFSEKENYISAFMKQINKKTQEIVSENVSQAIEKFDIKCEDTVLGLAGGFTLNCPTNTFLMDEYNFKRMQIPPCANDCGEAMGIGLLAFYHKMDCIPKFSLKHPFYGADLNDFEGDTFEDAIKIFDKYIINVSEFSAKQAAEDIKNNIVVWVQGRAEIGPRALGHRSLLANPTSELMKDELNRIKERQWWRPVAPIVIEEYVSTIFEQRRKSPFMLEAFDVKEEWKEKIPAIVHLDGTARVQTISESDNDLLYRVIQEFNNITDVPVICNTSLNDRGEPIIQTVSQAIDFCLNKGISILYVNGMRVCLKRTDDRGCNKYSRKIMERNTNIFSHLTEDDIVKINQEYNQHGLNKEILTFYYDNPEVYINYDLDKQQDCEKIIKIASKFMEKNAISLKREIL